MVLLPLSLFGPATHFAVLLQNDHVLFEAHETYPKQTCRNHFNICTSHGIQKVTVPVTAAGNTPLADVRIASNWDHRKAVRAIATAYGSAPYFLFYSDEINQFLLRQETNLLKKNLASIRLVLRLLKQNKEVVLTTAFQKSYPSAVSDYRYQHPSTVRIPVYPKVFACTEKPEELSILDLVFNAGPDSASLLMEA